MIFKDGEIDQVLIKLEVYVERERGSERIALCPGHELRTGRRDENPSWSINVDTGVHHCFSCNYKGNILTLIAEQLEFLTDWGRLDLDAAKHWLRTNSEVDLDLISKQMSEVRDSYISIPKPVEMSEARLALYVDPPDWALQARDISIPSAVKYGIRWDKELSSWILPIRNPDTKKLIGWQEKGQLNRHFKNRPTGVQKSSTLFGIDAWEGGQMILVESPLDAVRLDSLGFKGAVACYGAHLSPAQLEILCSADSLIIAFDNPSIDTAGCAGAMHMLESSRRRGVECWFFNYSNTSAKDIGDMSPDEVEFGITNARHCVLGKAAILS
jgi:hypothetical protein